MSTEITKPASNDAAPSWMTTATSEFKGAGLENVRSQDVSVPRVSLMQALSPEVAETGKFRSGDAVDSITNELLAPAGQPINFVVIKHVIQWIKWKPRKDGGGIADSSYDADSALAHEYAKQDPKIDGKLVPAIVEYHNFIIMLPDVSTEKLYMLSCGKTQWKHAKNLITRMKMRGGDLPSFAGLYKMEASNETNKNNQTYKVWKFDNNGWVSPEVLEISKKAYKQLQGKVITTNADEKEGDAGTGVLNEKEI